MKDGYNVGLVAVVIVVLTWAAYTTGVATTQQSFIDDCENLNSFRMGDVKVYDCTLREAEK